MTIMVDEDGGCMMGTRLPPPDWDYAEDWSAHPLREAAAICGSPDWNWLISGRMQLIRSGRLHGTSEMMACDAINHPQSGCGCNYSADLRAARAAGIA